MSNICKEELNEFWLRREPAHRRRNRQKVKKQQMQVWRSKIFVKLLWYWWNDFWISLMSHPAQCCTLWPISTATSPQQNGRSSSADEVTALQNEGGMERSKIEVKFYRKISKIEVNFYVTLDFNKKKYITHTSVNFVCRPWLMTVQELLRKYGFGSWTKPEEVWRGRNISRVSVIITTILLSKKWPYATKKGRSKATPICH